MNKPELLQNVTTNNCLMKFPKSVNSLPNQSIKHATTLPHKVFINLIKFRMFPFLIGGNWKRKVHVHVNTSFNRRKQKHKENISFSIKFPQILTLHNLTFDVLPKNSSCAA